MLQICPNLSSQKFEDPPFEEEILAFIRELGYPGDIKLLSDVKRDLHGVMHKTVLQALRTQFKNFLASKGVMQRSFESRLANKDFEDFTRCELVRTEQVDEPENNDAFSKSELGNFCKRQRKKVDMRCLDSDAGLVVTRSSWDKGPTRRIQSSSSGSYTITSCGLSESDTKVSLNKSSECMRNHTLKILFFGGYHRGRIFMTVRLRTSVNPLRKTRVWLQKDDISSRQEFKSDEHASMISSSLGPHCLMMSVHISSGLILHLDDGVKSVFLHCSEQFQIGRERNTSLRSTDVAEESYLQHSVDISRTPNFVSGIHCISKMPFIYIQLFWNTLTHDAKTGRSLLHDNIIPKPDLALELGKAEEEAVAREVHATHARIGVLDPDLSHARKTRLESNSGKYMCLLLDNP
ncbi:hypothetical protein Tco_0204170 [Tanacetum coccineum]